MPDIVKLRELAVSLTEDKLTVKENTFKAEARANIYKAIKDPENPSASLRFIRKDKAGEVTQRPISLVDPMGLGYQVIYLDSEASRNEMMEKIVGTLEEKCRDLQSLLQRNIDQLREQKAKM